MCLDTFLSSSSSSSSSCSASLKDSDRLSRLALSLLDVNIVYCRNDDKYFAERRLQICRRQKLKSFARARERRSEQRMTEEHFLIKSIYHCLSRWNCRDCWWHSSDTQKQLRNENESWKSNYQSSSCLLLFRNPLLRRPDSLPRSLSSNSLSQPSLKLFGSSLKAKKSDTRALQQTSTAINLSCAIINLESRDSLSPLVRRELFAVAVVS